VALVPLVAPRVVRRLVLLSRRGLALEYPAGAQFADAIGAGLRAELAGSA
jgi:hypothetical protein